MAGSLRKVAEGRALLEKGNERHLAPTVEGRAGRYLVSKFTLYYIDLQLARIALLTGRHVRPRSTLGQL